MSNYTPPEDNKCIFRPEVESGRELENLRSANNPNSEPVGHHTGRCGHCGSDDLWSDNLAYGCNKCKAFLGGN